MSGELGEEESCRIVAAFKEATGFADPPAASLGEALPQEMARVRDLVLPAYLSVGAAGAFAVMGIRRDLDEAARALAEGDAVACIRVYRSLKEWHV